MAPKYTIFRTSSGLEIKKPIPLQVQREMDVCFAMDALEHANRQARTDLAACAAETGTETPDAADSAARHVAKLSAAIGRLDSAGNELLALGGPVATEPKVRFNPRRRCSEGRAAA